MKTYYDFDFLDENQLDRDIELKGDETKTIVISKEDIKLFFDTVAEIKKWAGKSIYKNCFKRVYLVLTDCPATPIEFVDIDEYSDKLFVHMNVLSLIVDYHYNSIYRKIIFKEKWESINLKTYIQFFFLHELGHIVHATLTSPQSKKVTEKFEQNVLKHQRYHMNLDKRFSLDKNPYLTGDDYYKLEVGYRKMPHEQFADRFAFNIINELSHNA